MLVSGSVGPILGRRQLPLRGLYGQQGPAVQRVGRRLAQSRLLCSHRYLNFEY
jgi:hypothetical protein